MSFYLKKLIRSKFYLINIDKQTIKKLTTISQSLNEFIFTKKDTSLELKIIEKNNRIKILNLNLHWLRFNCQSAKSKQPSTGQRLFDNSTVPLDLKIDNFEFKDGFLHIKWTDCSKQDDSILPIEYIINNYPTDESIRKASDRQRYKTSLKLEFFDYEVLMKNNGQKNKQEIFKWIKNLAEYGVNIVKNVPTKEKKVKELAELIAPVQQTIYGEIFDVKVEKNPINIAYSNAQLGFHMDLMYYESSPGLQFLHCLKFDDCIVGGENLFVDSFQAAEDFSQEYPELFSHLTRIPATFQKLHIQRDRPVIMVFQRPHIVLNNKKKITAVNWSPAFEGPLKDVNEKDMKLYYKSYLQFSKFLNKSKRIIEYRLKEGEAICFNNRRILHARKGFNLNGGTRHFQGCYVNIDEFKSEALVSEYLNQNEKSNESVIIYPGKLELQSIIYGNHDYF